MASVAKSRHQGPGKSRFRSFGFLAFISLIVGLLSIPLAGIIYVAGMFSVIGIPIAIIALLVPTLCLFVVIAYLVWRIVLFRFSAGVPVSFAIALAIMLAVPQAYNYLVRADVKKLHAGDIEKSVSPLQSDEALVVIKQRSSGYCDEICVELLLSGQVAAYAGGGFDRRSDKIRGDAKLLVHRLVNSSGCDKSKLSLKNEEWKKTQQGTAARALASAERQGKCIRSNKVLLSDLENHRIVSFASNKHIAHRESAMLIDTQIRPWRFTVYAKDEAPGASPVYQKTIVNYSLLQPLLAYSVGQLPSANPQWWRKSIRAPQPKLRDYLISVLGLRLALT